MQRYLGIDWRNGGRKGTDIRKSSWKGRSTIDNIFVLNHAKGNKARRKRRQGVYAVCRPEGSV